MRIFLAPMEGVVDHTMRTMLTQVGGIDRCVTEFVRVTTTLLPPKTFYRLCPELHKQGLTPSGVPVYVQLLGGQPEPMAINAERAAQLGAPGIDINFGCPAKQVNRSDGGSVLLQEPDRVFAIVDAVRKAVPASTPVTVKIRLGFNDRSLLEDVTQAIFAANASELTIHARTKEDGYKPPAYWDAIADIYANSPIPIIANGEIWSVADYHQCIKESGCQDIMLGRGILACPDLARQINATQLEQHVRVMDWLMVVELLVQFCVVTEAMYERKYVGNRVKQWLGYLRRQYPQAAVLFEQVKRLKWPEDIAAAIALHKTEYSKAI
ncbi:tRNA-dihydrouridine synthase [Oceanicoccus sagamiensis]|uniref:tRNA-dihydrouridine(16) synthase n=1 Tax=Oceanicoccus sagamiensis TaxID=716816 RepID=A0A1X9NLL7_9GAMM|nr:tRNA-dihydrouridine synthase [Oceanicoccus sagamiensis]ARN74833.1 tRNA dihydrouridine(16) synthase DusC [Oceanicoccus sagamiensis]